MQIRKDDNSIEITLGFRRLSEKLRLELGAAVIVSFVVGGFVLFLANAVGTARHIDSLAVRLAPSLAAFALVFALALRVIVRHQFTRVTFRITRERLEVNLREPFRAAREFGWRREAIFEVRLGGTSQLHIRLRRDAPCRLLHGRSTAEINEAAAAINSALTELPVSALPIGLLSSSALTYEAPEQAYEIEIRETADGVFVTIPQLSGDPLAPVVGGIIAVIFVCGGVFFGTSIGFVRARLQFTLFLPMILGIGLYVLVEMGFHRLRPKRPVTILVTPQRVRVEGAGLLRLPRNWKARSIVDVKPDIEKDRNGHFLRHVLAFDVRGRSPLKLCGDRELIEIQRVAATIRRALHLPPLEVKETANSQ